MHANIHTHAHTRACLRPNYSYITALHGDVHVYMQTFMHDIMHANKHTYAYTRACINIYNHACNHAYLHKHMSIGVIRIVQTCAPSYFAAFHSWLCLRVARNPAVKQRSAYGLTFESTKAVSWSVDTLETSKCRFILNISSQNAIFHIFHIISAYADCIPQCQLTTQAVRVSCHNKHPKTVLKLNNMYHSFHVAKTSMAVESYSLHYSDIIMGTMASQITSLTIVCSTVYSGRDQRKHQSSASLAFVRGIHRWLVNCLHKWPVTWNMFPFDDAIMSAMENTPYRALCISADLWLLLWVITLNFVY